MKYIKAFGLLLISSLFIDNIKTAPAKECANCSVVLIDTDGNAWGKENGTLCNIPKRCSSTKSVTSKTPDPKTLDTKTPETKSAKTAEPKVLPPAPATAEPKSTSNSISSSNSSSSSSSNSSSNNKSSSSSNSNNKSNSSSNNNSSSSSNNKLSSSYSSNSNSNQKTKTRTVTVKNKVSNNATKGANNNKGTMQSPTRTIKPAPVNTNGPHETDANGNMICNGCTITATGGDNSLWGWESEKSCVIDEIKCNVAPSSNAPPLPNDKAIASHKKDSNGNLICNLCKITATGDDKASYWGWEDDASCIIDKVKCGLDTANTRSISVVTKGKDGILICNSCEITSTNADGTLWGTDNGEPCRILGSRCNINYTPHEWCEGCDVTATGDDGTLFGWEKKKSCVINEQTCGFVDKTGKPVIGSSTINIVNSDQGDGAFSQKANIIGMTIASIIALVVVNVF